MSSIPSLSLLLLAGLLGFTACKKPGKREPEPPGSYALRYSDSVLYLNGSSNQTAAPAIARSGSYSAAPQGLKIDPVTGVIDVDASETGLRYKVKFVSPDGQQYTTFLTIGGINYLDKYYFKNGDSLARPIYNGDPSRTLPGGTYSAYADDGSLLPIMTADGKINVRRLLRTGLLKLPPESDRWEEIEIRYRNNDGSNSAANKIPVIVYYYDHESEVPQEVLHILNGRVGLLHYSVPSPIYTPGTMRAQQGGLDPELAFKPRPPCIIIIGN